MRNQQHDYRNAIGEAWQMRPPLALWRQHSDAVNIALLKAWWPDGEVRDILKTDLFDEAVADGLYSLLHSKAENPVGVDLSKSIINAARTRHADLRAVVADVRSLPFSDDTFDLVVSNSTLDHFQSASEIVTALHELCRVLRPRGRLVLTLDNRLNPIVALRNLLPFRPLNALGVVPYYVGATLGPSRLRRAIEEVGFKVNDMGAIMHCPRLLAVPVAGLLERHGRGGLQQRFLKSLTAWEHLSRLPIRYLTGHFVAVNAAKPS